MTPLRPPTQQAAASDASAAAIKATGGLEFIDLSNRHGRTRVCLQGAQLIDYQPAGQAPVLWLSPSARFETGKAIRGGIPICWPWFGDHPGNSQLPAHGFARTSLWQVLSKDQDNECSRLRLGLSADARSRALWPFDFRLELLIELGQRLTLILTTHNPGNTAMPISEALHSYFAVGDIHNARICGLEGCHYRDKLKQLRRHRQRGILTLDDETDRVYRHTGTTVLEDPQLQRRLIIRKHNSRSTVVWNPWAEKARAMNDVDDQGYRRMLCIETANALDDSIEIAAGASHSLKTSIESILNA